MHVCASLLSPRQNYHNSKFSCWVFMSTALSCLIPPDPPNAEPTPQTCSPLPYDSKISRTYFPQTCPPQFWTDFAPCKSPREGGRGITSETCNFLKKNCQCNIGSAHNSGRLTRRLVEGWREEPLDMPEIRTFFVSSLDDYYSCNCGTGFCRQHPAATLLCETLKSRS